MRRITENVFAEIYFWGCNPGFVKTSDGVFMVDTPQQPINAVQWRERLNEHGTIRHLVNTEPHPDHIRGNAYFPGVEVIGHDLMVGRYEQAIPIMTGEQTLEALKTSDPERVAVQSPGLPAQPSDTHLFRSTDTSIWGA